jgi:hypothetical protein
VFHQVQTVFYDLKAEYVIAPSPNVKGVEVCPEVVKLVVRWYK